MSLQHLTFAQATPQPVELNRQLENGTAASIWPLSILLKNTFVYIHS